MEVWVVVASKYGSTREIGEAIDEELKRGGHDCRALDADEIRSFKGAGAVILGSAVYAGRWLKPAIETERLKRREGLLVSAMHAPVGDSRDWEAIRGSARSIGRELDGSPAS